MDCIIHIQPIAASIEQLKLYKKVNSNTSQLGTVVVSARFINLEEAAGRLHQEARTLRDQPDDGSKYLGKAKSVVERLKALSGIVRAIDQLTQVLLWFNIVMFHKINHLLDCDS